MKILILSLLSLISLNAITQEYNQKIFNIGYTHQFPVGNLSERFGDNSSIGISYLSEHKSHFFYGFETNYLFSDNVKDSSIFENISTSNGALIGTDGHYANVNLMQRGFDSYLILGYAYHLKELTGFYFSSGIGFLQHKIFIDTKNQNLPQLNEEYKKGYDRLTNGLSTKWEVSYKYYSQNGRFQMNTAINMVVAYTKNRRPYLFDQEEYVSDKMNWDKLFGISVGIIVPINRKNEEKFHYY